MSIGMEVRGIERSTAQLRAGRRTCAVIRGWKWTGVCKIGIERSREARLGIAAKMQKEQRD